MAGVGKGFAESVIEVDKLTICRFRVTLEPLESGWRAAMLRSVSKT
jgi:hypothetical protein